MSSVQVLSGFKLEIDLVQKILKDYTTLTNSGKSIALCWIPSHVNIPGNERADAAAKSALSLPITGMKLPGFDLIPRVSDYCLREWQEIWSNCVITNCTPSIKQYYLKLGPFLLNSNESLNFGLLNHVKLWGPIQPS